MNGPSEHLSWSELACKNGTAYPDEFRINGRAEKLGRAFEFIRAIYDKPIKVLSAYRTFAYNKKIKGARNSQHCQGRALDLLPPEGITVYQFYSDIRAKVEEFGINGIGSYKTFVHIDIRPSDRLIVWSGTGMKDSTDA